MADQTITPYKTPVAIQKNPIAVAKQVSPAEEKRIKKTGRAFVQRCREQHEEFQDAVHEGKLTRLLSTRKRSYSCSRNWWYNPFYSPYGFWFDDPMPRHGFFRSKSYRKDEDKKESSQEKMIKAAFRIGIFVFVGSVIPLVIKLKDTFYSMSNYRQSVKVNDIVRKYGNNLPRPLRGDCKKLARFQKQFDTKIFSKDVKYLGSVVLAIAAASLLILGSKKATIDPASMITSGVFCGVGSLFLGLVTLGWHWNDKIELTRISRNALPLARRISI